MRRRLLPSISELVAFECAGRHGSFTRAAEELNLTQSAISRQIRLLEEQIGAGLFERVRQRVILTPAGRIYLSDAQRILSELSEATHQVMSQAGAEAILNVAVPPTLGARWLAPRLSEFTAENPEITINFCSFLTPFDLGKEAFDAAIHYGAPTWPGASCVHLMDEYIVPVCSPKFRDLHDITEPGDLARVPLLHMVTRPTAWLDWFDLMELSMPHGGSGPIYDQFLMALQAVAGGIAAALVPRFLAEEELRAGQLIVLFDQALKAEGAHYLVTPEGKANSPAVKRFSDWLIAIASEQP